MLQYPEVNGTEANLLDSGPVAEVAQAAEDAGWDGIAFTEHPAPTGKWLRSGGHQTLDPFVALGHVAAVTRRLTLLTYLSVFPYRNPMLLAKAAASVSLLSGGRFVLGAGTGYSKAEFHALGVDFDERNALFDETLDVLPRHWSGEAFDYQGRHFSARDIMALPRPERPIPIWIGGNSQLTRRRVAERANGWMPLLGPDVLFTTTRTPALHGAADLAPAIARLRQDAGARGADLDIAVAYQGIDDPSGDPARHRAAFKELEESGVTWTIIAPVSHGRGWALDFVRRFAVDYLGA